MEMRCTMEMRFRVIPDPKGARRHGLDHRHQRVDIEIRGAWITVGYYTYRQIKQEAHIINSSINSRRA